MGQPSGQRTGHDFALRPKWRLWRSERERVLWSSMKSRLFFQAHHELHPPCERKPSVTTCPKQSLSFEILQSSELVLWVGALFLWALLCCVRMRKGS